jgi:putative membrane protein
MIRTMTGIAAAAALALAPQAFAEDKTAEQKAAEKKAEARQEYGEKTAEAKQEYREQKAEASKDAAEAKAEAKEEGREVRASSDQPKNTSDAAADQTRQTTGSAAGTTSTHDTTTGGTTGTSSPQGSMSASGSGSGSQAEQKTSKHDNTDLIKKLYTSNRMEVEAAKIAKDNGQSDGVKQFAERMEQDHGDMADKLKELADARGATLDEDAAMKQHKAHLDQMENMKGAKFDRHYTQMMKQHHEKSAKDVNDALKRAKQTGDHELAQLLETAKTTISEHRTLAKSLDAGKGQRQGRRGETGSGSRTQGSGSSGGQGGSMGEGSGSTEQGKDTGSGK